MVFFVDSGGGPEQGYECCFVDVTNRGQMMSATLATSSGLDGNLKEIRKGVMTSLDNAFGRCQNPPEIGTQLRKAKQPYLLAYLAILAC